MNKDQQFLKEIAAHPDDNAPKLVYADWLEERGDERANLSRLVVPGLDGSHDSKMKFRQAAGFDLRLPHPYADEETELWTDLEASLWPLFAADCAERALPLFERLRPDDSRPRRAIESIRLGTDTISPRPAEKRPRSPAALAYYSAMFAAASALFVKLPDYASTHPEPTPTVLSAAREAAQAAALALGEHGLQWESAEGRWQFIRLAEYKLWGQAVGLFTNSAARKV